RAQALAISRPLDGGLLIAALAHLDGDEAIEARDAREPLGGVPHALSEGVRAARHEGGHQASCSALARRFSATSACQNSLALEVSTSNSNRATMSGSMSATST